MVSMTSSSVSPMPATMPDLVEQGPALGVALGPELARAAEQCQRSLVVALDAHLGLDAAARLDVVVEDVRACGEHRAERLLLPAEEVGRQHLDRRVREPPPQRADGLRPVLGAAVGEVVAVDRGHDDVAQPHARSGRCDLPGLERIERVAVLAGEHRAVAAGARAGVSHDLERRGAAPEALADVGTARLLADGVQAVAAQDLLQLRVARARRRHAHPHPRRPLVRERSPGHRQTARLDQLEEVAVGVDEADEASRIGVLDLAEELDPARRRCRRGSCRRCRSRAARALRPPRRTRATAGACAPHPRPVARRPARAPRIRPRPPRP